MPEFEYVVIDPVLGEVSCESVEHAQEWSANVNGQVFCVVWERGYEINRYPVAAKAKGATV